MPNPFDNKDLGQQAVLNFATLRKKKNEVIEVAKENTEEPIERKENPQDMQSQIMTARLYANKEIKQFKEAVDVFSDTINALCMFNGLGDVLKAICMQEILEGGIEPVLKGNKPHFIPDEMFLAMRKDMYKKLIARYVLNKED